MPSRPRLSDITTTPENPPQFWVLEREGLNVTRDMSYPIAFGELQRHGYPEIQPLKCDLPASQVFELVQAAALEMPRWEIAGVESGRLLIEAVVSGRMPVLFKSDVVIQVRPDGESSCTVHMRAKARRSGEWLGGGAEARWIRVFLRRLRAKLD